MTKTLALSIVLLFLARVSSQAGDPVEIFVAPDGNDAGPGTTEQPLASLAGAKSHVKKIKSSHKGDIIVWFKEGEYSLGETVVFGLEDGAAHGYTIRYSAMPGEKVIISSDVAVTGWKKYKKKIPGLPKEASGKIWVASLPEKAGVPNILTDKNGILPRSRTEGMVHLRKTMSWTGSYEMHTSVKMDPSDIKKHLLPDPENKELVVIGHAPWTMNIIPVASAAAEDSLVQLAVPSTYYMAIPRFSVSDKHIWVENSVTGLDQPGEWVVDPGQQLIYLWPREDEPENIAASTLVEYIRIEGDIHLKEPADIPVTGIEFNGFTFRHGRRFLQEGLTGTGLQHDWEKHDASTAMVRLRGAENCAITNCVFEQSGGTAVRLDLHAMNNKISGNTIRQVGGCGILLAGYGPGTKDVNKNNLISNNEISKVGTFYWHSIGIWMWQSGYNTVSKNYIHNVPYTAIAVTGRVGWDPTGTRECSRTVRWDEVAPYTGHEVWEQREKFLHSRRNLVEGNDAHDVMEVLNDGNAVYVSGAGGYNVVRGNYFHDTYSMAAGEAIRCDDDQNDTYIEQNIIYHYGTHGIGLCSKGRNHFFNNIVACPPDRVNRGMFSIEPDGWMNHAGSEAMFNIYVASQADQPFVFPSVLLREEPKQIYKVNLDRNLFFSLVDNSSADEYLEWARSFGQEIRSVNTDPMFMDVIKGDFRLKPESPLREMGFNPMEWDPADWPSKNRIKE